MERSIYTPTMLFCLTPCSLSTWAWLAAKRLAEQQAEDQEIFDEIQPPNEQAAAEQEQNAPALSMSM